MAALRSVPAPVGFALRRVRVRPLAVAAVAAALAAGSALIGWSSVSGALAQDKSVKFQLRSLPAQYRSVRVRYYTLPLEPDFRAKPVEHALRAFTAVTTRTSRVQVWHSIEPNNPQGTRLVIADDPRRDVVLARGRLPTGCRGDVCEAVALSGRDRIGERVALGEHRAAVIVGEGSVRPELLGDRSELGGDALLVRSVSSSLEALVKEDGSTVVYSAPLDPEKVDGYALAGLTRRLRHAIVRLERGDPLVQATAPLSTLDGLAHRGRVARERLLLVAAQAAALVIAFAAFVALARRRETELADSQLTTLGASRAQLWTARVVEALVPSVLGLVVALAGLIAAAAAIARARGLPAGFVHAALPPETLLAIVAAALVGFVLLLVSVTPPRRSRLGLGPFELAAVTALGVVVWQTTTTGALDPDRVAAGGSPVILVLPTLGFFAAGVLLLRVLPVLLRVSERAARRAPIPARLALLTSARSPAQTAAATTLLAVALGSAAFSLDYRATLDRQARDQARFTAGAMWRVSERSPANSADVTPLTRFARVSAERPTPVARLDGAVVEASPEGATLPVRVLAVPASRLTELLGWRRSFSSLTPSEIAARLRPRPVRLAGPRLAQDASALRVWARSQTDYPRRVVLHLLLPGQDFAHLSLGVVSRRWRLLTRSLPRSLRDAQLIGIEYTPTYVPIDFKYDPNGFVDLGRFEQRSHGVWSALPSLSSWTPTTSPDGTAGIVSTTALRHAPVPRILRFDLNGTFLPLIHPKLGLPVPDQGFENGPVPVLAGPRVADAAVDGLVTLDLPGKQLEGRVVGSARLFPTITGRESSFVVLDYETLFAVMNADQPGRLTATEAWFFRPQRPGFASRLGAPPFRRVQAVGARQLEDRLLRDPLAAGTRSVLTVAAVVAAALSLLGLVLAARSTLAAERLQLAEYEVLGVARSTLRRSAQVRLLVLAALGVAAGLVGGVASGRLTASFVAVTGTAKRPLPPIAPVTAWAASAVVVGAVVVVGALVAAFVSGSALRESTARRLRA
jgi:hypothetical protein